MRKLIIMLVAVAALVLAISGRRRTVEDGRDDAEGGADRAERAQRPRVHAVDAPRASQPAEEVRLRALRLGEPVRRRKRGEHHPPVREPGLRPGHRPRIAVRRVDRAARTAVPEDSFAWGTAGTTYGQPNVYAYEANSQEGGYVNGYIASLMSKTKVLGVIGPIAVGDAKLYVDGFVAGAKAQSKKTVVNVAYTGSFSDPSLMSKQATQFVAQKADVLTGSSQSVVGAITVARENNLKWFGTQWTQASLAPEDGRRNPDVRLDAGPQQDHHARPGREARRCLVPDLAEERRREDPVQQGREDADQDPGDGEEGRRRDRQRQDRRLERPMTVEAPTPGNTAFAAGDALPLLEMRGITKRFPGVVANDRVDFDVRAGEVHTLFGENGAGKSTLMRVLYGFYKPDEGEIRLRGEPVAITSPAAAIARGIGMIHQHFMLVNTLTVAENVALGTRSTRRPLTDLERRVAADRRAVGEVRPPRRPAGR